MLGRIRKAFALQRDDALIALAGERLIEGEGEITLAEHVAKARLLVQHREPVRVVAYIAPQRACLIIAHQQVDHAALRLRLKRELPSGFLQRRSQTRGVRQRLRKKDGQQRRTEERRVGKEGVGRGRSRRSPDNSKTQNSKREKQDKSDN